MRNFLLFFLVAFVSFSLQLNAQDEEKTTMDFTSKPKPMDDIAARSKVKAPRMVLKYAPIRENDILYEKRIWREIDTKEKMNLTFRYPEKPFFSILREGIESGAIQAYSPVDDKFSTPLQTEELALQFYKKDTVQVIDPVTDKEVFKVVENEINPEEINRYRIKEIFFFDNVHSTMKVRILGIAPIREVFDENGKFLYEYPLFWVYYPNCREFLSNFFVFNDYNDKSVMTWEDLFEMRFFSSFIIKESNIHDRRLQDYLKGRDLLLESERIKNQIFNYEQDLWSY